MDQQQKYKNLKLGERGVIIGLIAYISLSVIKLLIGSLSHSEALKADGLNNTTDIISSTAILIGLKFSRRPADDNHPYGHWKGETIASLVASFIMMVVGLQVLYGAVLSLFQDGKESPDLVAGWTGLFCAGVMYLVYCYNKNLAGKIDSQSVMAAAKDNLSDAWVSLGASAGIFGSQLHMPWLDIVAAIIVGILICKTAWDIFREATYELTDGFDAEKMESFKETIENLRGVKGVKDIRARSYGNNTVVDVVILVNSNLAISEAHEISSNVEKALIKKYDVYDVHVHVEPN